MELTCTRQGDVMVLALGGSLDVVTSGELEKTVIALIDSGEKRLLFDLAQLDYVSSAGLRVFMLALKKLQGGGHVRFCALNKQVRQIFDIAGLSFRVETSPTREEALRGFPGPSR